MKDDPITELLLWSLAINYGILLVWFASLVWFREPIRRLHRRWFDLSDQVFDGVHYASMAVYKLAIVMFNLTPLLAIQLLG